MYRVLQLGKHYPPFVGGTENFIRDLTKALNAKGVGCDVLCANHKQEYEEVDYGSYRVMKVPNYFRVASTSIAPGMIKKLKEVMGRYQIIHVHMPDPMANLALFLSKPKAKIVLQWHMEIHKYRYLMPLYRPLLEWLFKRADRILVSSNTLKESSEFSRFMKYKVSVVPLGIDIDNFVNSNEDQQYGNYLDEISRGRKIVLSVGRLVYYKGFDVLIEAAKYMPEHYMVFIVGDGPLRRELARMIALHGVKEKVFLLGNLSKEQLVTCYRKCHVFCLPSKYKTEAFGLVQVEAMCFGKPVVSTKLEKSGVCEVNIHERTGLCVEPNDSKSIAKAVHYILEDEEKYIEFSKNARERSHDFHINKIANKIVEIYEEVL